MFLVLLQLTLLLGWGAAQAVTPKLAPGGRHTVMLKSDGTLVSVGSDGSGQLGQGRLVFSSVPLKVDGLPPARKVVGGKNHSLVLAEDGAVWTWGSNEFGQLADGTTSDRGAPMKVVNFDNVIDISAGYGHSIALRRDGTVWSWGVNWEGVLGDGTTVSRSKPVPVANLSNVTAITAGQFHNLALKQDGTVWAWGRNDYGKLGDGTETNRSAPVQVVNLTQVIAIAASNIHTIALKQDGTVWVWGGFEGQSDGRLVFLNKPAQVANLFNITAIAIGENHFLALKQDGTVWAWGSNKFGELGDGTTTSRSTPVQVTSLANVSAIAAGVGYFDAHSLAVKRDGSVWAWGKNESGELGDDTTINRSAPVQVTSLTNVTAVGPGERYALALKQDGTVWAWGDNTYGKLGDNSSILRNTPLPVANLTDVTAISSGHVHTLALKKDGSVWAWGDNYYGGLCNGTLANRSTPSRVGNLTNVAAVAAGYGHTLALKQDGTVWACGYAGYGAVGSNLGTYGDMGVSATLVQIENIANVTAITTGGFHNLALKQDGSVWAWGLNDVGQLGNASATTTTSFVPVQVENLTNVVAIAAGRSNSLALKQNGTVWMWGNNLRTPAQVGNLTDVIAIIGGGYTLVQKRDGTVWKIDAGVDGVPNQVTDLANVITLAAGEAHVVAQKLNGTVLSLGNNDYGQLGDGTYASRSRSGLVIDETAAGYLSLTGVSLDNSVDPLTVLQIVDKTSTDLSTKLSDLRLAGFNGSVYFTALVPKGSSVVQQSNSFASGGTESVCFTGGRTGAKQGPQTPCTPVASGAGVITTGNNFAAYTGASVDPLQGTNAIICMGITLPELSAKGQVLVRAIATGDTPTGVTQCPTVQTEATTRLYRANATGGISNLTMDAVVTPQPEDRGQVRKLYSWAVAPDGRQLMQSETQGWLLMQETMEQARTLTVPATGDVTLPIVRGANLSGIAGTLVYVGLGSSWEEVKQLNKAGHYYTIE